MAWARPAAGRPERPTTPAERADAYARVWRLIRRVAGRLARARRLDRVDVEQEAALVLLTYLAWHDGEPAPRRPAEFTLYKTLSADGGRTWSTPEAACRSSAVHLCEPGCVRSPDGKPLTVLLRENSRRRNSHVIFSDDEGKTWTEPKELPGSLTGDRHAAKYAPDGRWVVLQRLADGSEGGGGRVLVRAVAGGEVRQTAELASTAGRCSTWALFGFSPDGRWFAARDAAGRPAVYEVGTWRPAVPLTGWVDHVAFTPDGRRALAFVRAAEGYDLRVWDTATGQEVLSTPCSASWHTTAPGSHFDGRRLMTPLVLQLQLSYGGSAPRAL